MINNILKSRVWSSLWLWFSRSFIMLGLPMLAWGLDDISGFVSSSIRGTLMIVIQAQAIITAWMLYHIPPQTKPVQNPGEEHWHYSLMELVFIIAAYGDKHNAVTWNSNAAWQWLGVVIYSFGSIYGTWTNYTWVNHLRREAGRAKEIPALLGEGPYTWTRHPSLLSLIAYSIGFSLAFRSWTGLVFTLAVIFAVVRRINIWEADYAERYPKIWPLRKRTSKRIVPFLY
ncbi:MAG: hypothetical protein HYZ23_01690 [Chloroflexi bacterium]|nr:hypothetical protein [Chloroflexota bacterium]